MISRTINHSRQSLQRAYSSTTTPQIPPLFQLDKKWSKLKELEQADIIDHLNGKAQGNWKALTPEEKKAIYYIYYGEWGPRSTKPQKSTSLLVLKSLFSFVLLIGTGVGLYNYAIDQEHNEKLAKTIEKVIKIKTEEQQQSELKQSINRSKKGWLWW